MSALLPYLRNALHVLLLLLSVALTHLARPAHFETSPAEELQTRIFIMASLTVVSLFVVRIEGLFVREECIGEEGKAGREKVRNDLVWLEGLVGLAGSGWWTSFAFRLFFKFNSIPLPPVFQVGSSLLAVLSTLSFTAFFCTLFSDDEDHGDKRRVEGTFDEEKSTALAGKKSEAALGGETEGPTSNETVSLLETTGWAFLVGWSVACAFVSIRWTLELGLGSPAHLFILPAMLELLLVFRSRTHNHSLHLFTTSAIYILHSYATAQFTMFYFKLDVFCQALRIAGYPTPLPCDLSRSVYVLSYIALGCLIIRLMWLHSHRPTSQGGLAL